MKKISLSILLILMFSACSVNPPSIQDAPVDALPWELTANAPKLPSLNISTQVPQTPVGGGTGWIAFISRGDVYTVQSDGLFLINITDEIEPEVTDLTWSPNGEYLGFLYFEEKINVCVSDKFGKILHCTNISGENFEKGEIAWSPDSLVLAILDQTINSGDGGEDNMNELYFVDGLKGGVTKQILGMSGVHADMVWSPDGAQIAF